MAKMNFEERKLSKVNELEEKKREEYLHFNNYSQKDDPVQPEYGHCLEYSVRCHNFNIGREQDSGKQLQITQPNKQSTTHKRPKLVKGAAGGGVKQSQCAERLRKFGQKKQEKADLSKANRETLMRDHSAKKKKSMKKRNGPFRKYHNAFWDGNELFLNQPLNRLCELTHALLRESGHYRQSLHKLFISPEVADAIAIFYGDISEGISAKLIANRARQGFKLLRSERCIRYFTTRFGETFLIDLGYDLPGKAKMYLVVVRNWPWREESSQAIAFASKRQIFFCLFPETCFGFYVIEPVSITTAAAHVYDKKLQNLPNSSCLLDIVDKAFRCADVQKLQQMVMKPKVRPDSYDSVQISVDELWRRLTTAIENECGVIATIVSKPTCSMFEWKLLIKVNDSPQYVFVGFGLDPNTSKWSMKSILCETNWVYFQHALFMRVPAVNTLNQLRTVRLRIYSNRE